MSTSLNFSLEHQVELAGAVLTTCVQCRAFIGMFAQLRGRCFSRLGRTVDAGSPGASVSIFLRSPARELGVFVNLRHLEERADVLVVGAGQGAYAGLLLSARHPLRVIENRTPHPQTSKALGNNRGPSNCSRTLASRAVSWREVRSDRGERHGQTLLFHCGCPVLKAPYP